MNILYDKSCTENEHRHSDSGRHTRHSSDTYDSRSSSSSSRQSSSRVVDDKREKDISATIKDPAYSSSSSSLLINRDEIVLSYPEKTTLPAKEPVISLDMEDDEEERIMQADWGNEADDDDQEDHATLQKQHKRLSTVEREEIERTDRESKGIWVRHTADDGRLYYYNSVTRESVWEIPNKSTATPAVVSAPLASVATSTDPTQQHTTARTTAGTSDYPHKALSKQSHQPRSCSAPTASTSSNNAAPPAAAAENRHRDHTKEKIQVPTKRNGSISTTANSTTADKGQRRSNSATRSTKTKLLPSTERRTSYISRQVSHRGYVSSSRHSRSRSRSPLPPPPPRDPYYDDYRYHHRSPSPPPYYRHYPPYERYSSYYAYNDRIRHLPPPPPPPPPHDLRYRYYDPSPPPPLSPPPSYYRSRERSWERYEAAAAAEAHRSRYYR